MSDNKNCRFFKFQIPRPMHTVDFPRDDTSDAPPTRAPARAPVLPAPVLSWLQRVEAAAHPQPKLTA